MAILLPVLQEVGEGCGGWGELISLTLCHEETGIAILLSCGINAKCYSHIGYALPPPPPPGTNITNIQDAAQ